MGTLGGLEFKWQGFEVSAAEELWEDFKSCIRWYLGQGGTGKLGASGLEGIQNLEGTGKLYVGQTALRQEEILERTETGKVLNSWLTTLRKTMKKGWCSRRERSRMRWLLERKALKELQGHRNKKLSMMSWQETGKGEWDRNKRLWAGFPSTTSHTNREAASYLLPHPKLSFFRVTQSPSWQKQHG